MYWWGICGQGTGLGNDGGLLRRLSSSTRVLDGDDNKCSRGLLNRYRTLVQLSIKRDRLVLEVP